MNHETDKPHTIECHFHAWGKGPSAELHVHTIKDGPTAQPCLGPCSKTETSQKPYLYGSLTYRYRDETTDETPEPAILEVHTAKPMTRKELKQKLKPILQTLDHDYIKAFVPAASLPITYEIPGHWMKGMLPTCRFMRARTIPVDERDILFTVLSTRHELRVANPRANVRLETPNGRDYAHCTSPSNPAKEWTECGCVWKPQGGWDPGDMLYVDLSYETASEGDAFQSALTNMLDEAMLADCRNGNEDKPAKQCLTLVTAPYKDKPWAVRAKLKKCCKWVKEHEK